MNNREQFSVTKNDIILLSVLLTVGFLIFAVLIMGNRAGARVVISVEGQVVDTISLKTDTVYEIHGKDGGQNLLIIMDGQAWIEEASCPDGLCTHMGKIHYKGQSIVCLPNEVVVSIEGGLTDEVDAISK